MSEKPKTDEEQSVVHLPDGARDLLTLIDWIFHAGVLIGEPETEKVEESENGNKRKMLF